MSEGKTYSEAAAAARKSGKKRDLEALLAEVKASAYHFSGGEAEREAVIDGLKSEIATFPKDPAEGKEAQ